MRIDYILRNQLSLSPAPWPTLALITLSALLSSGCAQPDPHSSTASSDPLRQRIPTLLNHAAAQYDFLLQSAKADTNIPRTVEGGKLRTVPPRDWTSGFVGGSLWYIFEATGDPKWKSAAHDYTLRVESIKDYKGSHDVGFMLNCSFGNGYRLTQNPQYRDVLLQGARTLSTRYNPNVGAIRSWDFGSWKFPVIIDNMMNLELLQLAAKNSNNPELSKIAVRHADTTLKNHYRPDMSTWHVVDYDPATGAVLKKQTHQGAADHSAWARGQAWGLYGYVMMYRETRDETYRQQALNIADFLMNHPRLPADKIPYWDFDAPGIPNEPRDASAGAITASALIELSAQVDRSTGKKLLAFARDQLLSLASRSYLAPQGQNGGFLLMHCVGNQPRNSEVDVPLNYADYYFLEALLRYRALK